MDKKTSTKPIEATPVVKRSVSFAPSDAQFIDEEIQCSRHGATVSAVVRSAIQALKEKYQREKAAGESDLENAAKLKGKRGK